MQWPTACMVSHHHWASAQLDPDGQLLLPPHWAYMATVTLHPAVVVVAADVAASNTHHKLCCVGHLFGILGSVGSCEASGLDNDRHLASSG